MVCFDLTEQIFASGTLTMSSISVVIPAYNAGRFLPDAVASLRLQTRLPDEVLIIDDGSTDDTLNVARQLHESVREFSIRIFSHANAGVSHTRNVGINEAKGELIALLDADDYLESEYLALAANGFKYGNNMQLVFASAVYYDEKLDNKIGLLATRIKSLRCSASNFDSYHIMNCELLFDLLLHGSFISQSACMFRKTGNIKLFNTRFSHGEDRLFLLNMLKAGAAVYVDKDLARIRRHPNNATNTDSTQNVLNIISGRYELNNYLIQQAGFSLSKQQRDVLRANNITLKDEYNYFASLTGIRNYLKLLFSDNELIERKLSKKMLKSIIRCVTAS